MTIQLIIIFILTAVIHTVQTGAYAARLAGVRTGRLSLAGSLYNVMNLVSRGANAFAAPLLASLTDTTALNQGHSDLLRVYQIVMLSSTAGTLIAALLIPTVSRLLERGVASYEHRKSLSKVVVRGISVRGLRWFKQDFTQPRIGAVQQSRRQPFPKRFLLANILVNALATVSNFAALYASVLVPEGARTATSLSPIFAGMGLSLTVLLIDPVSALIVDETLNGKRPHSDVTYLTIWQIGARLAGTLVAQALLWPMGQVIAAITQWLM
ncbi:MAG: DUF2837 family protein [Anaerolineae bacterium]|nr:DUF2837 family protein [Anaerolineae bacterium]